MRGLATGMLTALMLTVPTLGGSLTVRQEGMVDVTQVAKAEKVWPGIGPLLAAIRVQENGRTRHELGHKSGWIYRSQEFPADYFKDRGGQQYGEAGRSVAKFALEYCMAKERRGEWLKYLGSRYTRPDRAREWTVGVSKLERVWRKRLRRQPTALVRLEPGLRTTRTPCPR